MVQTEVTEQKSKKKLIIIVLLVAVLILSATVTYFLASNNLLAKFIETFQSNEEYTFPLEEFIVNLKAEPNSIGKNYVRFKIALMYTEKKQGPKIESSTCKIRDIIVSQIREKTYNEILDNGNTPSLKSEIKDQLNEALSEDLIKDVYITDIMIQ